jgi:hypothetical protein
LASSAVTAYVTPILVPVAYEVLATPDADVCDVAGVNTPPPAADATLHVTVRPSNDTKLPLASTSCAVTEMLAPATGALVVVTTYRTGAPGTVVSERLPLTDALSVAVIW